jgi:mannose-6-phosphate isomerase-like protein (cupin superfamily)
MNTDPTMGGPTPALEPIDVAERLSRFSEIWSPKVLARLDGHEVKVVKMLGEFTWHTHPDTDELFLVVSGHLRIEMRHGHVELGPGALYVVPRGVEHRPVATIPTESILIEPAGVVNTGDAGGPLTAVDEVLS